MKQKSGTTDSIRILYIIDIMTGNLGGTERQLIEIINGLDPLRFKKHLVCFDNSPWFQRNSSVFECDSTIVNINKFRQAETYLNILKLIKFIRDYKPDLVHTFFPVGNIVGAVAARLAGVRNVFSSRRDYGEWMDRRYLLATKLANKFVARIITNSHAVRKLTEKEENITNGKIEVIYNGIVSSKFKNIDRDHDLKRRLKIPAQDFVVGIIANFRPMKHHFTFVRAAQEVLQIRKDISFLLVGGTLDTVPMMKQVEALAESLNIKNKLFFAGLQEDVVPYLSIMDIGVNCSEKEGLSNAIMEYMASGVPCVVSRAGGNPDLITHNENGYTFEIDDYRSLADLTLKLLANKEVREKFIDSSLKKVEREMGLEAMLCRYENLYGEVVGKCHI